MMIQCFVLTVKLIHKTNQRMNSGGNLDAKQKSR